MLDLADLEAFVRIADLRGISAAARSLNAPKSSVSRSLARLEAAVGTVLVERSSRYVRLTDAGALLHPYAKRILGDVDEAETLLTNLAAAPRGTLRVNAPFSFAVGLLAPMLPDLPRLHPAVRVVLDINNRWINVGAEEADIVIRVGDLADSSLIARRLASVELWLCASPDYLSVRGTPASVADLGSHELISWTDRTVEWSFRSGGSDIEKIAVRPGTVIPEPAALQILLTSGSGIGRLPDFIAVPMLVSGELVRVLPDLQPDTVEVHALYPSHRSLSAKVRVFIDALACHLRKSRTNDRRAASG